MATTQEQIDALELAIVESATTGVTSVSVDGTTVSISDAKSRLEVLKELRRSTSNVAVASQPHMGMRFTKLIPPRCG